MLSAIDNPWDGSMLAVWASDGEMRGRLKECKDNLEWVWEFYGDCYMHGKPPIKISLEKHKGIYVKNLCKKQNKYKYEKINWILETSQRNANLNE